MYAFVSFSDPTGMFEVMLFPEVLAAAGRCWKRARSLLITASADWDGDDLKLRAASITDLDQAAARRARAWWCGWISTAPLSAIAAQLMQPGKGLVSFVVPGAPGEEVEIALTKRHAVTATLRSTIAAIPGVISVEAV